MHNLLPWSIAWVLAYLIGSIPFGFIVARGRGIDIRKHGSGNIGATNVGRVLGKKLGFICFGLDVAKGLVPTLAAGALLTALTFPLPAPETLAWLGVAAMTIVGHMFPVWLNFKGGKGVATGFGALLGVYPVLTLASATALLVWVVCVKITRYVGISSCIAAVLMPLQTWAIGHGLLTLHRMKATNIDAIGEASQNIPSLTMQESFTALWPYLAVTLGLAILVIYRHRGNIKRTIAGTESKVGQRVQVQPDPAEPK
jgi:glycerol-3-phosphate acyltransferase PlsY